MDKSCLICAGKEWVSADHFRAMPENMVVCKSCGFITFDRFKTEEDYYLYYDLEYRNSKSVNSQNVVTTNRKIGYHQKFLAPWLKGKKDLVCGEIGAGIGYFLRWLRDAHGVQDVSGSELTTSFRRYAEHAFQLPLTQDFDYSKKYDLICIYHTLEHIPNADEILEKARGALKEGGILYVATPIWMEELFKFGGGVFTTFDDHFHRDHVNAWSRWHLKSLYERTGWKIVTENKTMYGWTVMLQPADPKPVGTPPKTSDQVLLQLSDMQRAAIAYTKRNYQESLRLYPQFVDSYLAEIGSNPKEFDKQMQLCTLGEQACPNTKIFNCQRGLILYQYGRLEEAERELAIALDSKPHDDNILLHLGMIQMRRGDALKKTDEAKSKEFYRKAIGAFEKIININPNSYGQCMDYIGMILSNTPGKNEVPEPKFTSPHAEGRPFINVETEPVRNG